MSEPTCKTCGVAWSDHLGPTALCAQNSKLAAENERLRQVIMSFACEMAVSYSDPRLNYHEVQVAVTAYDEFKELAAALSEEKPTEATD